MRESTTPLAAGQLVAGDFVVQRPLAEGGMGAVYAVMQKSTGRVRALKVMHRRIAADSILRERFVREARIGARVVTDHIVEMIAAGVDEALDLPYLVMELLEGETLAHRMVDRPLTQEEARDVLEQVCHALTAAHEAGVIHRDLKPENVFLARTRRTGEGSSIVKLLDFGIAKLVSDSWTETVGGIGSPLWMAPEQTDTGTVDASADVWALGLLAFMMLTDRMFWRCVNTPDWTRAQLLREIVVNPIPRASERARELDVERPLAPAFDSWFARCVAREPSARFRDARAAWAELRTVLGDEVACASIDVVESAPAPVRPRTVPHPRAILTPMTVVSAVMAPTARVRPRLLRQGIVCVGVAAAIGVAAIFSTRAPRTIATAAPAMETMPREPTVAAVEIAVAATAEERPVVRPTPRPTIPKPPARPVGPTDAGARAPAAPAVTRVTVWSTNMAASPPAPATE